MKTALISSKLCFSFSICANFLSFKIVESHSVLTITPALCNFSYEQCLRLAAFQFEQSHVLMYSTCIYVLIEYINTYFNLFNSLVYGSGSWCLLFNLFLHSKSSDFPLSSHQCIFLFLKNINKFSYLSPASLKFPFFLQHNT